MDKWEEMRQDRLDLHGPGMEGCDTCRWHVEIVGLGRPHPERCMYHNVVMDARTLDILPGSRWCMYYKEEEQ